MLAAIPYECSAPRTVKPNCHLEFVIATLVYSFIILWPIIVKSSTQLPAGLVPLVTVSWPLAFLSTLGEHQAAKTTICNHS